ncbi:MAG: sugar transferase [Synergistaceae bacterium]|jgi:lipopolysaccharide/colanic/teichoic acid biosynthesis glycosyltransferase|nr:sugar transferase [Synergistaceae bacterium]
MFYGAFKRILDVAGATFGLLVFSPLMLWATARIRREMSPPAIFAQTRAGKGGSPFKLYKFRTMTNERGPNGELLPDEERLTAFGTWLRRTSLDELPQLWNVLKGDMSLVGPRPLLLDYVPRYNETERRRLDVIPGITGWAQINGRNSISWREKFALDVWYVENRSSSLDVKIIALTIKKTLKREDISAKGEATMPPFLGSGRDDWGDGG